MTKPTKFNAMMNELCVGQGFCGGIVEGKPSHVTHYLPDTGPVSAEQFAKWVLSAEGMDPDTEGQVWQHKIESIFIKHMGDSVVDAADIK